MVRELELVLRLWLWLGNKREKRKIVENKQDLMNHDFSSVLVIHMSQYLLYIEHKAHVCLFVCFHC